VCHDQIQPLIVYKHGMAGIRALRTRAEAVGETVMLKLKTSETIGESEQSWRARAECLRRRGIQVARKLLL